MNKAFLPEDRQKQLRVIEDVTLTSTGRIRKNNEDAVGDPQSMAKLFTDLPRQQAAKGRLYALADGMGGLAKGEAASQLALETLFKEYYNTEGDPLEVLTLAVKMANKAVYQLGTQAYSSSFNSGSVGAEANEENPENPRSELGSTLVGALILNERLLVCNIGDSRAYLCRAGKLTHLTRDHSMIAEGIQMGLFTEEQVKKSPFKNVLTRAVGQKSEVKADFFEYKLLAGDILLLCSDGLYGRFKDQEIVNCLLKSQRLLDAAQLLIEQANAAGGPDNISVVVIKVGY